MKGKAVWGVVALAVVAVVVGVLYFKTGANQQASLAVLNPKCLASMAPRIVVTSPNGGEVYQPGQQITVKWTSCNVSPTSKVNILLNVPSYSMDMGLIHDDTINDGSETITLPSQAIAPNMPYGKLFKVKVGNGAQLDMSDNLFTINDPWTTLCADGKPHVQVISPNGGEFYTPGQQIEVKWRTCNVQNYPGTNSSAVSVSLKQQSTGVRYTLIPNTNPQYGNGNFTQNDGSEMVVLPTSSTYPVTPISYGTDFRVTVALTDPYPPIEAPSRGPIFDESDNLFTINKSTIEIGAGTPTILSTTTTSGAVSKVTYTIPFTVTALSSDLYIGKTSVLSSTPTTGSALSYSFTNAAAPTMSLQTLSGFSTAQTLSTLDATVVGNAYYLPKGAPKHFNVTVTLTKTGTNPVQSYNVVLQKFQTYTNSALTAGVQITPLLPVNKFSTDYRPI
jgi:hypothetical protein